MEVKPGYKQTEAGVIPKEWEAKTIDQVGFVTSGKRLPLGCSLVAHPTPHPYVRVTDMRPGTVSLSEIKFVPESVFPAIKRYRIFCEDIFISVAGSLGIVGKVPKELDGANLTENADRITNITCSQDFLLHVLMSPLIQNTIDSIQTVGAQPKLALTRIRKFSIPYPPLPEQRAIAGALSDVDALLGALDQLITKKRDLKQAAMQQLLTGQTRLPGFHGEWGTVTLEDACVPGGLVRGPFGGALKKEDFVRDGKKVYEQRNAIYHDATIGRYFIDEAKFKELKRFAVNPGNFIVSCAGTIGRIFQIPQGAPPGVINQALLKIETNGDVIDPNYFLHYFNWEIFQRNIIDNTHGGAMQNLVGMSLFRTVEFARPPLPEQTAIAEVLTDMDAELAALEQRRAKTRALKQGMMQELLTGRTRLVES